tara:strand:+ start:610 stop:783 length:174 start_codon:yes stop_codon:yes gene_type:complete
MDTLEKAEIIYVDKDADGVWCDGGNPALGHPKVWYSFEDHQKTKCGYCGRIFLKNTD